MKQTFHAIKTIENVRIKSIIESHYHVIFVYTSFMTEPTFLRLTANAFFSKIYPGVIKDILGLVNYVHNGNYFKGTENIYFYPILHNLDHGWSKFYIQLAFRNDDIMMLK